MKYTICHFLVLSLSGFGNRVMLALWNELRNIPFFLYLWGVCIKLVWVLPSVFLFLFLFSFLKSFIKIFLIYFFYWRIIALQNFVFFFFCQTSTWISHISPPFWTSLPIPSLLQCLIEFSSETNHQSLVFSSEKDFGNKLNFLDTLWVI